MWNSIYSKIKRRISELPDDSAFSLSDFFDLGEPKTVSKTLTRLEEKSYVRKLMRGVFCKNLGESYAPNPDSVAQALGRGNCWQVVPSGDTAMHIIGANEEEPIEWTYITDGTNRKYKYGKYIINFKHASGKFLKSMSAKSALLVQVIKAHGRKPLSPEFRNKILSYFTLSECKHIVAETKNTTVWIFKTVCSLFEHKTSAKQD